MSEWGNPHEVNTHVSYDESIVIRGETWGTETSKYPQEKKSTEIPQVVASERGGGQTRGLRSFGVVDQHNDSRGLAE
jgi:hypothetical protein